MSAPLPSYPFGYVQVDMYSGRANPTSYLSTEQVALLQGLLDELVKQPLVGWDAPPPLGYRGLIVSFPNGVTLLTYNGKVLTPVGAFEDVGGRFEGAVLAAKTSDHCPACGHALNGFLDPMHGLPPIILGIQGVDLATMEKALADRGYAGGAALIARAFPFVKGPDGRVSLGGAMADDPALRPKVAWAAIDGWNYACSVIQSARLRLPLTVETTRGLETFSDIGGYASRYVGLFDEWEKRLKAEKEAK